MKLSTFLFSILALLLLAPLPAQSQNFDSAAEVRYPGLLLRMLQQQIYLLRQRITVLEAKLANVSVNENDDLVITGINLYIQNGLGTTSCGPPFTDYPCNSAGNLILGYDTDIDGNTKTGSHNLVIGDGHTYTSYSGIVLGRRNEISAPGATVTGGVRNIANGLYASVSGGQFNIASGDRATVSGGQSNTASGDRSSVSGGENNVASGFAASISGGDFNLASDGVASIGGGSNNVASNHRSSVSGGENNLASGPAASICGGWTNIASGPHTSVSGGSVNNAAGTATSVSGGASNIADGINSTIGGGFGRATPATGNDDWIAGSLFEDF